MKRTKKQLYEILKTMSRMGLGMTSLFILYFVWNTFSNVINIFVPIVVFLLVFYFIIYLIAIIMFTKESKNKIIRRLRK